MTTTEERLARDIKAVVEGVVMTQTDLEQARDQVDARLRHAQRRGRRRAAIGLAAAAAVAVGIAGVALSGSDDATDSAPADPAPPSPSVDDSFLVGRTPTEQDLQGVWRVDNGTTLVRFGSDDDVAFDTQGQILTPEVSGTYTLEGDQITVDFTTARDPDCRGPVVLRAAVTPRGDVRMLHTQPAAAAACAPEQSGKWLLEHLLPTRPGYLRFGPPEKGDFGPLRRSVLPGFWMVVGGGYGIQLTDDGSFSVADDSGQVIDEGQWQLDGAELALTSDVRGCRVGISDVQHINAGTDMIRGKPTQYTCDSAWASGEWFRIPDSTR